VSKKCLNSVGLLLKTGNLIGGSLRLVLACVEVDEGLFVRDSAFTLTVCTSLDIVACNS
jgi:hypothetical protein